MHLKQSLVLMIATSDTLLAMRKHKHMLRLYTEEYFFTGKVKAFIKRLLGRYIRGPQVVVEGLCLGLFLLGIEFTINKKPQRGDICGVLNGVDTLHWAIEQKKLGVFSKLIAGPNIVVSPEDSSGILKAKEIDVVLVPSMWVQDAYRKESPEISGKIAVWAAGVATGFETKRQKRTKFLILNKIPKSSLYTKIAQYLSAKGYSTRVFSYGSFKQRQYFRALEKSEFLVYLSETESQGLAMFEAAARGVPVFGFEPGHMMRRGSDLEGIVATPYLSREMGLRFHSFDDFVSKLPQLLSMNFDTRTYIEEKFSVQKSAEKYMEIIHNV